MKTKMLLQLPKRRADLRVMARTRPPQLDVSRPSVDLSAPPPPAALEKWKAGIRAADQTADNVITIFDVIGEDFWTGGGFTDTRMSAALRKIGNRDVEVQINSPGGDMFEGISIFNILQAHPAKVTVKIMGMAASAASLIAMAGDEVLMGQASFLMIHNCWVIAMGNRHDMREVADYLEPFDAAMRDLYVARTGQSEKKIGDMLDAETWIGLKQAVDLGFAEGPIEDSQITEDTTKTETERALNATRQVESVLTRKGGMSRSAARSLISGMKDGKPGAAADMRNGTPGAADPAPKPGAGGEEPWVSEARKLAWNMRAKQI